MKYRFKILFALGAATFLLSGAVSKAVNAQADMLESSSAQTMPAQTVNIETLKFSESDWDPFLLEILKVGSKYLGNDAVFDVKAPYKNSSDETKAELELLKKYQAERRDPETLLLISIENDAPYMAALFKQSKLETFNSLDVDTAIQIADQEI